MISSGRDSSLDRDSSLERNFSRVLDSSPELDPEEDEEADDDNKSTSCVRAEFEPASAVHGAASAVAGSSLFIPNTPLIWSSLVRRAANIG